MIATAQIGDAPYELGPGVQILDLLGLADPLTAHLQLAHRGQFTGHEKPLPTPWVVALLTAPGSLDHADRRPSDLPAQVLHPFDSPGDRAGIGASRRHGPERHCPVRPSTRIEYGPNRPLTIGSFISNIVHSVSNSTVRIPPDPETAFHRFCGPGVPASVTLAMARQSALTTRAGTGGSPYRVGATATVVPGWSAERKEPDMATESEVVVVQGGLPSKVVWQMELVVGLITLGLGIALTFHPSTSLNVICVIIGILLILGSSSTSSGPWTTRSNTGRGSLWPDCSRSSSAS